MYWKLPLLGFAVIVALAAVTFMCRRCGLFTPSPELHWLPCLKRVAQCHCPFVAMPLSDSLYHNVCSVHKQNLRVVHAYGQDERAGMRANRAGTTAPVPDSHGIVTGEPVQGTEDRAWQHNCTPAIAVDTLPVPWCSVDVSPQPCGGVCPPHPVLAGASDGCTVWGQWGSIHLHAVIVLPDAMMQVVYTGDAGVK